MGQLQAPTLPAPTPLLLHLSCPQVCSRGFNATAATVVCKQLELGPYGTVLGGARFGPGSGPVLLDEVRCTGAEASLLDCAFKGW